MKHKTLIDDSGDSAAEGGRVVPAGHSTPGHNVQSLSGSVRTQAQD